MFSVRRIVGTLIVAGIGIGGATAAGHSYSGHGGASGDFCEFTLQQNHTLEDAMSDDTLDLAGMQTLVNGAAADLRKQSRAEVKPQVLAAGDTLAAALSGLGAALSADEFAAADVAYGKAIEGIAAACNEATGQKVGVEDAGTEA